MGKLVPAKNTKVLRELRTKITELEKKNASLAAELEKHEPAVIAQGEAVWVLMRAVDRATAKHKFVAVAFYNDDADCDDTFQVPLDSVIKDFSEGMKGWKDPEDESGEYKKGDRVLIPFTVIEDLADEDGVVDSDAPLRCLNSTLGFASRTDMQQKIIAIPAREVIAMKHYVPKKQPGA